MSLVTKACPSCAHPLPVEAAFCMMCGAATPQAIDKQTGEVRQLTSDRIASPDKSRLQRALGTNYELGKLIGRGGFAEVFLVHDKRLKRDLALKALRPDLVISEQLLTRFRREAETVAALRHPNIVPIYDIGEADGIAYLLMPYIQGESLRALLHREGPRPVREAGRILVEASGALAAAHEAGVVHRDIKPENIMLEGKSRRVQLMDFGIAKAIDSNDGTPGLTSTGMLVGTPHYMSPEQASGELHLDHRSDQYSLAVVGFQMITGSLPFDGESTRAVLFQQMVGVPKSLRDLVPDVPAPLAFAVDRALSKDPKDRFPSMEEFMEAISGPELWPVGATTSGISAERSTTTGLSRQSIGAVAPPMPAAPSRKRWLPVAGLGALVAVVAAAFLLRPDPPATSAAAADSAAVAPAPAPAPIAVIPDSSPSATPAPPSAAVVATAPPPAPVPGATPPRRPTRSDSSALPAAAAGSCQAAVTANRWPDAARLCRIEGENGSGAAARQMGLLFLRGNGMAKSDSAAAAWFRRAVASGDGPAAHRLGIMYANGAGVTQNDVEATTLLRRAADADVAEAWPLLAERYEQGLGIRRSDQEAAFWYRRSADAGNRSAQYNIGEMYLRGRGVEKNENDAALWFARAAEKGHPGAEYQLGMLYIRGRGGLPKDEAVGLEWLQKAAADGHAEAAKEVEKRRRP